MTHYLRLEGVNLSNFIDDTKDLSTIRGGGLLLLEAVEQIKKHFGFRAVTTGASSGIFVLPVAADPRERREAVAQFLVQDRDLKHATFVVDVVESFGVDRFVEDREKLTALNRWRQMRAPTVAVPSVPATAVSACDLNRVRPASQPDHKGPEELIVSESVFRRRQHGRVARQNFYHRETGINTPGFCEDLDDLTNDVSRGGLHHKMAILFIDGNRFGDLQRRLCTTEETQREFDEHVKSYRRRFLGALIEKARGMLAFQTMDGRLRLETLMWGGDELAFALPAWMGLWTLAYFLEISEDWTFAGEPLRHATGLVFCHHKAPIHRIKRIAKELTDIAKKNRDENLVAYQVLETFDHTGSDLRAFRSRRCLSGVDLLLQGAAIRKALLLFGSVRQEFPRRKLHEIVTSLLQAPDASRVGKDPARHQRDLDAIVKKATSMMSSPAKADLARLVGVLGDSPGAWLHLADLWDYLVQE